MKVKELFKITFLSYASKWEKEELDNELFYIGGSDVLPAPLNPQEEAKAIEGLLQEDNQEAKSLLIEHNLRLVVYIAKKFENTGVGIEDLISIGTIRSYESNKYF